MFVFVLFTIIILILIFFFLSLPFYIPVGNFQGSQGHLTDTLKRIFYLRRLDYFEILHVYSVVANCTVNASQNKKQQFEMLAYYN